MKRHIFIANDAEGNILEISASIESAGLHFPVGLVMTFNEEQYTIVSKYETADTIEYILNK